MDLNNVMHKHKGMLILFLEKSSLVVCPTSLLHMSCINMGHVIN